MNATAAAVIQVELPAAPVSITVSRSIVRRIVAFRDPDAESSYLVALTEIVANAIEEHERMGSTQPIRLRITSGASDVIEVIDSGGGLSPDASAGAGPVSASAERGRGLALARAFVPGLRLESSPDGTSATLPLSDYGAVE